MYHNLIHRIKTLRNFILNMIGLKIKLKIVINNMVRL